MVTASVVAVMLLGSHGEAAREVKFLGALLAQADPADVNVSAIQHELDELVRTKPTLTGSAIVLSIGGGVALAAVLVVVLGAVVGGWDGVAVALLGVLFGLTGLVMVAIGLIMVIARAFERASVDAQIERLRARLPPPMPPSARTTYESTLILARF